MTAETCCREWLAACSWSGTGVGVCGDGAGVGRGVPGGRYRIGVDGAVGITAGCGAVGGRRWCFGGGDGPAVVLGAGAGGHVCGGRCDCRQTYWCEPGCGVGGRRAGRGVGVGAAAAAGVGCGAADRCGGGSDRGHCAGQCDDQYLSGGTAGAGRYRGACG
ncbi:Uncharacterised protein [Mycobacteroides abscessus subsp. massiliense]|nr:Uncharacterised protein [Mycobacteroides abscessus subsp. massiliense]